MALFRDGPYYSHTKGYDPENMRGAIDHLEEIIDEAGPFDGVLGFSQGAALALSYLHLCESRNEPSPFKFALCFSSVMPCSADPDYGNCLLQRICPLDDALDGSDGDGEGTLGSTQRTLFCDLLHRTVFPAQKSGSLLPNYDVAVYQQGGYLSVAPRLMLPSATETKIRIPTVHVSGKKDAEFMRNMAETARGLCDEKYTKTLEHVGGHQPPQKEADVKAAVRAMEWAISRARL
ncbi:hypothetical protein SODALDRAFT_394970 [Sodiomyces alkalinus F11]|uniref:Serine hydrolase domain-containing protein n=1 Tax=Sodiomyces alkalinus (strain CBS 110278 / VKM F-3762 / F11) TaxID=1314773 RepID=A0A3N2PKK3_SODAK|nr:hypothetical protein SODALDRAFT_394970 [Sodiomyces alkalinus F11]ROT35061.1 hypothetical protein SODALDRAFT_394970 [Sodiomyces alkalinus F11]